MNFEWVENKTNSFLKVDPKFLRNLRFSKKHNVRRPQVANAAAQKPAAPAVQATKPQKK
jgi:hypothetical protein